MFLLLLFDLYTFDAMAEYKDIIEKIEVKVANVYFHADGIVEICVKDKIEVELDGSKELFHILKKKVEETGMKQLVLVTGGNESTVTRETREFSATDEASSVTLAEAVVVRTLAHRLIINFLLRFYKPKRLLRMFTNEKDAVKWLHSVERITARKLP
jgi:hypothetical protein